MITDARIEAMTPRIRRAVRHICGIGYDADELFQVAVLAILEKDAADPDFAAHEDTYLVCAGVWSARDFIRAGVNRKKNHPAVPAEYYDRVPAGSADPARAVERRETLNDLIDAVQSLSPDAQIVVQMIYQGAPKSAIAARLNVSSSAVSHRRATIARQVAAAVSTRL